MLTDFVILDDSQADRTLVARSLKKRNYEGLTIRQAKTSQEALALVVERCLHCIVTDVHLPDASGVKLLDRLSEQFGGLPCPVVVVTGSGSEETAVEILQAGLMTTSPRVASPNLSFGKLYAMPKLASSCAKS